MAEIRLAIVTDAKGAVKDIRELAGATDKLGGRSLSTGISFAKLTGSIIGAQAVLRGVNLAFRGTFGTLADSVRISADFNQAFTESTAIMGDLSQAMRSDMVSAAEEVAKTTTFSAIEAAKSYFFLASAGLSARDGIKALPIVSKFAQAGTFDLARATDLLTDAQSALGLTIKGNTVKNMENMVRVSDVLVKANILSNATVEEFSESLTNKAGASLRQLGKDMEEGVAVLATFADQGIKGTEAGTALGIVLRDLGTKAFDNAEAFRKNRVAVFDSEEEFRNIADVIADLEDRLRGLSDEQTKATFKQLGFADKSVVFIQSLIGMSEQIRAYEGALRDAGGTTDQIAKNQLQSFANQVKLLQNNWQIFQRTLGDFVTQSEAVGSIIVFTIDRLTQLADSLVQNRGQWVQLVGDGINLTLGSIDAFLTIGGLLITGLGKIGQAVVFVQGFFVGLQDRIVGLIEIIGKVRPAYRVMGEAMRFGVDTAKAAIETEKELADSLVTAGEASLAAAAQIDILQESVDFATKSQLASIDAQSAHAKHQLQLVRDQQTLGEFSRKHGDLVRRATEEVTAAIKGQGADQTETFWAIANALGGTNEAVDLAQKFYGELTTKIEEQLDIQEKLGVALDSGTTNLDTQREAIAKLAGSLGVKGLHAEMVELNSAIELVNESGDRLSKQGLAQILDKMKRLREEGVQLEGRLAQISQKSREFGTSALQNLPPLVAPTIEWGEALKGANEELGNIGNSMPPLENYPQSVGGIVTSTTDWGEVQSNVNDFLSETRGLMSLLGVESDSVVGRIIAGFSKVFDMFNSLTGIVEKVLGSFRSGGAGGGGGGGGFLGLGNLFGGLFGGGGKGIPGISSGGIPGITEGLTTAGSTAGTGFLGGFGSTISGGLSSLAGTLAPLFTNPFTAIIGGGIAGFFAIKGFLKKANIEETVQRELGVGLSEGTKAALEDLAEQRGGDLSSTAQLAIGQIFREAAVRGDIIPADILAEEVGDLFSFLERGEINTEELGKALDDVVPMLIDRLDELGPAGETQIHRIVSAAKDMGVEFDGLTELALRFGIEIDATAEQVSAAFSEMGGNVSTLTEFMEKSATRTERAWGRVQRILGKIARGEELGETQTRFAGRVGLPVPSFAEGAFVPRPTLAVVGDAPFGEDVIPRRAPGVPGMLSGGSGADGGITINISIKAGAVIESRRELARTIVNTVKEGVERARNTRGLRRAIKKVSE